MALLCNHKIPQKSGHDSSGVDADDNDDSLRQTIGGYRNEWGQYHNNECLLITEGKTEIWKNSNEKINYFNDGISAIRLRPGYRITLYSEDNLNKNSGGDGTQITLPETGEAGDEGENYYLHDFNDRTSSVFLENPKRIREDEAAKAKAKTSGGSYGFAASGISSTQPPTPAPPARPPNDKEKIINIYNNFINNIQNNSGIIALYSTIFIVLILIYKFLQSKKSEKN